MLDAATPVVLLGEGELAPVLTATSGSVGTLRRTRSELRDQKQLVWFALENARAGHAVLKIRSQSFPVFIDHSLNTYAAALPAEPAARAKTITALLHTAGVSYRLVLLLERARLSQRTGTPDETIARWMELAEDAEDAGEPSLASHGLRSAAYYAYFHRRDFAFGDRALERAERLDRSSGFLAGQVKNGLQAGLAAQERGRLREAETLLREAHHRGWTHGLDREAAFAMKALGPLLQDQGRHLEALAALEAAGPTFAAAQAERERLWYENDLAWVLLRGGKEHAFPLDAARIRTLEESALRRAEKLELKEERASILANLAALLELEGKIAEARALCSQARALAPDPRSFSSLYLALLEGSLHLRAGELDRAHLSFVTAEEIATTETPGGTSDAIWRALYGQARVARAKKEETRALELYKRALAALERSALAAGFEGGRASYLGDRLELADDAVHFLEGIGRLDQAFELSTQFRAHLYRVLELEDARGRLDPAKIEELTRIERSYLELRTREEKTARALALAPDDQRTAETAKLFAIRSEARALVDLRIELLSGNVAPAAAKAIRGALQNDEMLFDFAHSAGGVRIFVVTRSKVEVLLAEENALVDAVRAKIPPNTGHVYVIAGDVRAALHLVTGDLIQRSTWSHLPHPGVLLDAKPAPLGAPLIAGDPADDLPNARAEANELRERWPDALLLLGGETRRERLLLELDGRRLFHFAGHGKLDGGFDAHLELAEKETLRISDVYARRANVGLVVLSGCEMGGASRLGPAHAIALPESFYVAGAKAVLAATEKIGDAEARRFILDFYAEDGEHHPVSAYAKAARKQLARGDSAWSSFRVVGQR